MAAPIAAINPPRGVGTASSVCIEVHQCSPNFLAWQLATTPKNHKDTSPTWHLQQPLATFRNTLDTPRLVPGFRVCATPECLNLANV